MPQPYWDSEGLTPGGVNPYADGVQAQAGNNSILAPDPHLGRTTPETTDPETWSAWDRVYLAGMLLPGVAKVRPRATRRIDKLQGPGMAGASPKDVGSKPCEIDIELLLWMPQHLAVLESLMPFIKPRPASTTPTIPGSPVPGSGSAPLTTGSNLGPNPNPGGYAGSANGAVAGSGLEVVHPGINILGIRSIYVVTIEGPYPNGKPQEFVVVLRCEEYVPPKSQKVTKISNSIDTDQLHLVPQIKAKVTEPQAPSQNNAGP